MPFDARGLRVKVTIWPLLVIAEEIEDLNVDG